MNEKLSKSVQSYNVVMARCSIHTPSSGFSLNTLTSIVVRPSVYLSVTFRNRDHSHRLEIEILRK